MVRDQARGVYGFDGSGQQTAECCGGAWADMAVSVDYVVRETASNLWRNRLMTVAAILTVAVSLSLVGAALLLRQGSANATGTLERGTQVTVWMEPNANAQEIAAVGTELAQLNYVVQPCAYWNKARNFAEARQLLPSDVFQATTQAEMPTSYWCTPVALADAAQVVRTFSGTAGVLSVTEPQQTIKNEETVINISKWVCLAIAIVLIVSAAVLILNTIRMAIFARRREVSVMKLVGATNWFIRVPFMSEGLLQGLRRVTCWPPWSSTSSTSSSTTTAAANNEQHPHRDAHDGVRGPADQRRRGHRGHGHRLHRLGHRHPPLPRRLIGPVQAACTLHRAGVRGRARVEAHRPARHVAVRARGPQARRQCAMAQSRSGLRVRGATVASTAATLPVRTSSTNCGQRRAGDPVR